MRISLVGTGYVGLTTGACLASVGHDVTCIDILPDRVAAINAGQVPFHEAGIAEKLSLGLAAGRLRATTDLAGAVRNSDIVFVAVGTPEMESGIDLSYIREAARQIGTAIRNETSYKVVVVKSTVVPGTTDSVIRAIIEDSSGMAAGDFGLCMNPEFLREGSAVDDFMNPDRIIIGQLDERSGGALAAVYDSFDCPKVITSLRNAEMTKYACNAFFATLISFSNEIAALCEAIPGTDVKGVLQGLHLDRRLSPVVNGCRVSPGVLSFLWAGSGFGGSCFPKDVNALRSYAQQHDVKARLLDAVMTINSARPQVVVDLAERALGKLNGANISLLGLAFKPGTDDLRESVALKVIQILTKCGAIVRAHDPVVGPALLKTGQNIGAQICLSPEQAVQGVDAVIITTACPEYGEWNWSELSSLMRQSVVIDGRNAFHNVNWPRSVQYLTVGAGLTMTDDSESVGPERSVPANATQG